MMINDFHGTFVHISHCISCTVFMFLFISDVIIFFIVMELPINAEHSITYYFSCKAHLNWDIATYMIFNG